MDLYTSYIICKLGKSSKDTVRSSGTSRGYTLGFYFCFRRDFLAAAAAVRSRHFVYLIVHATLAPLHLRTTVSGDKTSC